MATEKSLLFMPDISGFTDFVKQTEINHSQHIISELLEIIIDANELEMKVSEIEGDAVLFYKKQELPSTGQIIEQSKKMFVDFHNHLKKYETQRICPCGACSSASKLSLKIVAHAGDFGFITVKENTKPHGSDVILIHQLLKNNLNEKEYLLFSGDFAERGKSGSKDPEQKLINGSVSYDKFGEVEYRYLSFQPFRRLVKEFPPIEFQKKTKDPLAVEAFIDRDQYEVLEIVSNLDLRLSWNKGVDELKYEKGKVNRVSTQHTCLVNGKNLEFETVTNDFGKNRLVYGERIASLPIVKEFSVYNILEKQGKGTLFRIEVHYVPLPFIGWFLLPFFKSIFKKNLPKTLATIKNVCEQNNSSSLK